MQSVTSTIATTESDKKFQSNAGSNIDTENTIKVAVRIRRFLPNESGEKCIHILTTPSHPSPIIQIGTGSSVASYSTSGSASISGTSHHSSSSMSNSLAGAGGKSFFFDQAFPSETKQKHIFDKSVRPLVEACLKGYNATVLAYGQTGSGKTYTILGPSAESIVVDEVNHGSSVDMGGSQNHSHGTYAGNHAGVIPRAMRDLFNRLEATRKKYQLSHNVDLVQKKRGEKPYDFEVRVQFLELYGEDIRDLLSNSSTKLVIRDGGTGFEPEIIGASEVRVHCAEEALLCLTRGTLRRVTGATAMNSESSRSHAIMTIIVEQTTAVSSSGSTGGEEGTTEVECKRSKFHFVDLAGSERQKRSLAQGQRLKEGIDINKGLLVLGNVISALGDPKKRGKSFVPYRDSKLTRLLKGSLGGNHKTLMIACVSPSSINLEESLNCLRYANRARNIQNNAVINIDAGSRLVAELRAQLKALAGELLIFQKESGHDSSRVFKISDLKVLANGGDSSNIDLASRIESHSQNSNGSVDGRGEKNGCDCDLVEDFKAEIAKLKSVTRQLKSDLAIKSEELFATNAEAEYYRLGGDGGDKVSDIGSKDAFMNRVQEYEREIFDLKAQLRNVKAPSAFEFELPKAGTNNKSMAASPRNSRGRTLKPIITSRTEVESNEDDKEIKKITEKYLRVGEKKGGFVEDEDEGDKDSEMDDGDSEEDEDETFLSRQSILDSQMIQLSKGIAAKQELINKLGRSQVKYDKMKSFYQDKLKKMTMQLSVQEVERVNLEIDLKKNIDDAQKYKEVQDKLEKKQKHIEHLKKRQMEIKNLTSIASRNETVISNLTNEILTMKRQKDGLQHQLMRERKEHARSIQQLQKKAMMQQKGATKIRQQLAVTTAQKQRAQNIAKARAEKITELRSKYKGSEKKLRMQTLKRGMMERAGIDPVLIGRHERQQVPASSHVPHSRSNDKKSHSAGAINKMRNLLDEKISEISRKEAAADKLACEWEDHLQLTTRKHQIVLEFKANPNDSNLSDEIEALDFQIKYKESRIRQLAHRLGNKRAQHDTMMDDKKFRAIMSELPPLTASQLASKVLFGMVVRERRRVAMLARAACALDQKAVEAEKLASSKENTLRSLIDESKNERIEMAQSNQERILSLMDIVQSGGKEEDTDGNIDSMQQSSFPESVVLQLANQRIEILESEITELHQEKQKRENYQAREAETVSELTQLTKDYGNLLEKSKSLRGSLLKIRSKIDTSDENQDPAVLNSIASIVNKTLPSVNGISKGSNSNPFQKAFSDPYESDIDQEEDVDLPDWAGHIMKDLAIIAAGEVPASLKTPNKQHLPPTPGTSIFDRLSSPDHFTVSHNERLSDNNSVASNTGSQRSSSRVRGRSTSRTRHSTPTRTTIPSSSNRSDTHNRNTSRRRHYRSPSPLRQNSPNHSKTRLTDRVSAILKDGPPKHTPDDDDQSLQSFRSLGSQSQRSIRSQKGNSNFVEAYTKKDVFERLQKKHTNSFTLNVQASHSFENSSR